MECRIGRKDIISLIQITWAHKSSYFAMSALGHPLVDCISSCFSLPEVNRFDISYKIMNENLLKLWFNNVSFRKESSTGQFNSSIDRAFLKV